MDSKKFLSVEVDLSMGVRRDLDSVAYTHISHVFAYARHNPQGGFMLPPGSWDDQACLIWLNESDEHESVERLQLFHASPSRSNLKRVSYLGLPSRWLPVLSRAYRSSHPEYCVQFTGFELIP